MLMMRGPRGRDRPQLTQLMPMMRDRWGQIASRQQLTQLMLVMCGPGARVLIGALAEGSDRPQPKPSTRLFGSDRKELTRLML